MPKSSRLARSRIPYSPPQIPSKPRGSAARPKTKIVKKRPNATSTATTGQLSNGTPQQVLEMQNTQIQQLLESSERQTTVLQRLSARLDLLENSSPVPNLLLPNLNTPTSPQSPAQSLPQPAPLVTLQQSPVQSLPQTAPLNQGTITTAVPLHSFHSAPTAMPRSGNVIQANLLTSDIGADVKGDILLNKYIDLKRLCPIYNKHSVEKQMFEIRQDGSLFSTTKSEPKNKGQLSIHDWSQAWTTYVSLATEILLDPSLPARMNTHYVQVLKLNKAGKRWRDYDVQFRERVANPNHLLEWGGGWSWRSL